MNNHECLAVSLKDWNLGKNETSNDILDMSLNIKNTNQPIYDSYGFCQFSNIKTPIGPSQQIYERSDFHMTPTLEDDFNSLKRILPSKNGIGNYKYIGGIPELSQSEQNVKEQNNIEQQNNASESLIDKDPEHNNENDKKDLSGIKEVLSPYNKEIEDKENDLNNNIETKGENPNSSINYESKNDVEHEDIPKGENEEPLFFFY